MTDVQRIPRHSDARGYSILFSSGTTTGIPQATFRYHSGEAVYSVPKMRRPIVLTGTVSLRLANTSGFLYYNPDTESVLTLGKGDLNDSVGRIVQDFRPDSFFAFPSFLLHLAHSLKNRNILANIRNCIFVGEGIYPEKERVLREALPMATFIQHYSSSEVGSISVLCPLAPRNVYHPLKDVLVEILDAGADGVGEIAISKNIRPDFNLERFRMGDLGRFVSFSCPCGNQVSFKVLGRKGFDLVKVAGAILHREEFDRVLLGELGTHIIDYRVRASEVIRGGLPRGAVSVLILTKGGHSERATMQSLADRIQSSLRVSSTKSFSDLVRIGALLPIALKFVGEFPPELKDVKIRSMP